MSDFYVHRRVLANGLTVCMVPLNHLHRAHVALTHNVGSRHEPAEINGVSHFLEHVMFRGTRALPSLTELAGAFEDIGGNLDGSTGREFTVYETYLPPDKVDEGLRLLAHFLMEARLVGVQLERKIILEELKMELNEDGVRIDADSITKRVIFPEHPLGRSVLGTAQTLKQINSKALREHHTRYYCGANTVLTVVGRINDLDRTMALIEEAFASMASGERRDPEPVSRRPEPGASPVLEAVCNDGAVQTDVGILLRGLPERDPRFPAQEIIMRVVDDGLSTRLPRRMIDELGLAYSANGFLDIYRDTSVWSLFVTVSHGKVRRAVDELLALLDSLAEGGIGVEEFNRARNRARWELSALLDSPRAVSGWVATGELVGLPFNPEERLAQLEAVEKKDLPPLLAELVQPGLLSIVLIGRVGERLRSTVQSRLVEWAA